MNARDVHALAFGRRLERFVLALFRAALLALATLVALYVATGWVP